MIVVGPLIHGDGSSHGVDALTGSVQSYASNTKSLHILACAKGRYETSNVRRSIISGGKNELGNVQHLQMLGRKYGAMSFGVGDVCVAGCRPVSALLR